MAVVHREQQRVTADDLLELVSEGQNYELIEGLLFPVSPVVGKSGRLELRVGRLVGNYVEDNGLGETYSSSTGFRLRRDPDTVVSPVVAFIRAERVPTGDAEDHFLDVIPDLVIEVLSPSNRAGEMNAKILAYLDAGTIVVWVMDPKHQTVTVWSSDHTARSVTVDEILDGGDVLPGFSMRVRDILTVSPASSSTH